MGLARFFKQYQHHNIGKLMPVIGFNRRGQYFELDNSYIGNMYRLQTVGGTTENMQSQLEAIFKQEWPENAFIQVLFWANDDLTTFNQNFAMLHGDRQFGMANERLTAISKGLIRHFVEGSQYGLGGTDCRPRNFECFLCVKIPIKGNQGKPTKDEFKSYCNLRDDLTEALDSVGLFTTSLDEWEWKKVVEKMLNRKQSSTWRKGRESYNAAMLAREQVQEIGGGIDFSEESIAVDEQKIALLTPKIYPKVIGFGDMLNVFNDWRFGQQTVWGNFMIVLNIHFPDNRTSRAQIKAKRTYMSAMSGNKFVNWIDRVAWQRKDYNTTFEKLEQKRSRLVNAYLQFMVFGDDDNDLDKQVSKFKQIAASNAGFELERDKYLTAPLFLHSLPFGPEKEAMKALHRYNTIPSDVAAFLAPVFSSSQGNAPHKPVIPFVTRNLGMFGFNPFETDGSMNGLVVAESGSGKSVLVQYIVTCVLGSGLIPSPAIWNELSLTEKEKADAIALASDIISAKRDGGMAFIIDVGRSYFNLCQALGGEFISFGKDMDFSLNPFPSVVDFNSSEDPQSGMILEMLKIMADPSGNLEVVTSRMMADVLQEMWNEHGTESSVTIFQQMCMKHEDKRLKDVGYALKPYTEDGMHGHLFTTKKAPPSLDNPFIVCELEELKSQPENQLIALMQIINICYRHFFLQDGDKDVSEQRRKVFIVDECWSFLSGSDDVKGQKNPVATFLEAAFRRFRKVNASAWIITQMLSDVYGSQVGKSIVANCVYRCYLYQKKDTIEQVKKDRLLDLPDQDFELLKSIRTRKNLYSEIYFQAGDDVAEIVRFYAPASMLLLYSTDPRDKADLKHYTSQGYSLDDAIDKVLEQRRPNDFATDMNDLDNEDEEEEAAA
ncbi:TraC family protein [uncultured Photobacterium sp.]|uniref:TraC family protein n=1 Tax=uncultured Photobacterium sp. TaxID=173973 RepID=UPI002634DE98|nr:TraC family protein [uncultured Photobacterium sp.]